MTTGKTTTPRNAERTHAFSVSLELLDAYAFRVAFEDDDLDPLQTDELRPLGAGTGPSPSRLLAAAVANCLASSLLFCLRRSRVEVNGMKARATTTVGRNQRGRLRIERIAVELQPGIPGAQLDQLTRCRTLFEDYCTVTASIRDGIEIAVEITPTPSNDEMDLAVSSGPHQD